MPVAIKIVILSLTLMSVLAFGQEPQITALTFQDWKQQQILEAQNQMLRISTHINQLKSEKNKRGENKEIKLPNSRLKPTDGETVTSAEKELKLSQESLEAAGALQIDDYINIYLPTLQDKPEAVNKLAEKLSKEELAEIFKGTFKRTPKTIDAKHNVTALDRPASSVPGRGL